MKTRFLIVAILVVVASLLGVDASDLLEKDFASDEFPNQEVLDAQSEEVTVTRVIDGDTIEIETGQKIRYIGIDTPEINNKEKIECFAVEAKQYNAKLVLGKKVRLEKDVSETDRYGRLLRYVYLADTMINERLVMDGYAVSSTYPPDVKYQKKFLEAEAQARLDFMGLWSLCQN